MIVLKESFWSVPEEEWKRLWVRVRWRELPKAQEQAPADTECINVAELMERDVEESVGFRSLTLYSGSNCSGLSAVSPCLLDVDLDGDTQLALDNLLDRVRGNSMADNGRIASIDPVLATTSRLTRYRFRPRRGASTGITSRNSGRTSQRQSTGDARPPTEAKPASIGLTPL